MNLRWASAAVKEAEAAVEYYQQRKVGLGDEFATALDETVEKIKTQPDRFGLLETISAEFKYRRLRMPQFPYLVVFRCSGEWIEIVAIAHASREPNYWLGLK